eukprot:271072-Rhodomonas_salina.2
MVVLHRLQVFAVKKIFTGGGRRDCEEIPSVPVSYCTTSTAADTTTASTVLRQFSVTSWLTLLSVTEFQYWQPCGT